MPPLVFEYYLLTLNKRVLKIDFSHLVSPKKQKASLLVSATKEKERFWCSACWLVTKWYNSGVIYEVSVDIKQEEENKRQD